MIPREIYTLGAVQLNTQPLAALQGQLLAKKAARDEAFNKWQADLAKQINLEGVRQKDLLEPQTGLGIQKDIEAWEKQGIANRNAIQKGGMAQQEHLNKFQEIRRRIGQSKDVAKTELTIAEMEAKGEYDPDDDDIGVMGKIGYSIYDPRHYKEDGVTPYGIGDLSPAVGAFDAGKQTQFWGAVEKGKKAGKVYDESKSKSAGRGKVSIPYETRYDKNQILEMANDAGELVRVGASKEARKYYNKLLKDPQSDVFVRLKTAYDQFFPGQIMDTPEELAKADAVLKYSQPLETGEDLTSVSVTNVNVPRQEKKTYRLSDFDVLGKYSDKIESTDIDMGGGKIYKGVKVVDVKNISARDREFIGVEPIKLGDRKVYYVKSNGDWEGKGNQVVSREGTARSNLDKTTKFETEVFDDISRTGAGLPPTPKKQSNYVIGGKSFTREQVEQGAKKNKMTVKDYLSQFGINE